MAEFSVDLSKLRNVSSELSSHGSTLKKVSNQILDIQKNMGIEGEARIQMAKALNKIEAGLLEKAVKAENLSKALLQILKTIEQSEKVISGHASTVEKIRYYFSNALYQTTSLFGLDDEYYSTIINYENYDAERTQEKLMDDYLQYEAAQLLQEERFSEETWNHASLEEREQILLDLLIALNGLMGLNVVERLNIDNSLVGTRTKGYYTSETNEVTINPGYLSNDNPTSYRILQTMIHEMRHAYQHAAVNDPDSFVVSEETRKQWANNFDDYYSGDDYEKYVSQPIEWDAKNFAQQYSDTDGYTPQYSGSWD